jgi:hypothetical protein
MLSFHSPSTTSLTQLPPGCRRGVFKNADHLLPETVPLAPAAEADGAGIAIPPGFPPAGDTNGGGLRQPLLAREARPPAPYTTHSVVVSPVLGKAAASRESWLDSPALTAWPFSVPFVC